MIDLLRIDQYHAIDISNNCEKGGNFTFHILRIEQRLVSAFIILITNAFLAKRERPHMGYRTTQLDRQRYSTFF